jgi:hypothetical protein
MAIFLFLLKWVMFLFEKVYATDARINTFIRASVAYMHQIKTALKQGKFKTDGYRMKHYAKTCCGK